MNEAQRLATRLSAPGDAASENSNSFYLLTVVSDGEGGYDLVEQYKTDLDLISETLVASDVPEDTPVAYLVETDENVSIPGPTPLFFFFFFSTLSSGN